VVPGVGKTGVIGVIRGRKYGSGGVLGLRADISDVSTCSKMQDASTELTYSTTLSTGASSGKSLKREMARAV
jgi:hypothetical protein